MSAKNRPFPPDLDINGLSSPEDDELYTGFPNQHVPFENAKPGETDAAKGLRDAAKGRAAYAAQEGEAAAQMPRGQGPGSLGGLFAGPADQPSGGSDFSAGGNDLLSVVPEDRLREECERRLCPSCAVKKEADATRLRALADLDNAKKRLAREREEQIRYAAEAVLNDIVPSLDNLDLALQHSGNYEGCKDFVLGVQMTRKLLQDALGKHGLAQVGAVGEEFNPALHEAVGMLNSPDVPDNHVCALLSSGYTLNGRLLRPAKVMVCKK